MTFRLPNPLSLTLDERREYRAALAGAKYKDCTPVELDDGSGIYTTDDGSRFYLAAFLGKALRRDASLSGAYRTQEQRAAAIERLKESRAARQTATARRRLDLQQPHTLAVGDVLYARWGYEQTNVDFYEVVAVRGAVVDLRELAQDSTETHSMQGRCSAKPGQYIGEIMKGKRPSPQNSVRLTSFSWASPWDGQPLHWSSYA